MGRSFESVGSGYTGSDQNIRRQMAQVVSEEAHKDDDPRGGYPSVSTMSDFSNDAVSPIKVGKQKNKKNFWKVAMDTAKATPSDYG